ncbi:hypothetical protein OIC43_32885 [Streptomyces sp. NBC_00825]|nr:MULTISPECIES: hypothetical protein [unclassified Streptomyces]WTB60032.1 hypothetical protein OG832_10800 [Streptomyces sp. NBC_00826]WTH95923.1 hypothetical protein OIC43_32885 [Streptomyces sp. NBC_00825]WTI04643.1 hypothetical protein OHA23_32865 [Streptomyces sp. NBC_00822]MCX4867849.1 hypothetical protein [Streptomyces sp. NBC_00906]MCX4899087.1 hypothetical protein [Streptomyces sp. NBC_00892]
MIMAQSVRPKGVTGAVILEVSADRTVKVHLDLLRAIGKER